MIVDVYQLCPIKKKASRTNCTFGFCQHSMPKHKKPKEQFLTNASEKLQQKTKQIISKKEILNKNSYF